MAHRRWTPAGIVLALAMGVSSSGGSSAAAQELLLRVDEDPRAASPPLSLSSSPHKVEILLKVPGGESAGRPATTSRFEGHFGVVTTDRTWRFEAAEEDTWPDGCVAHASLSRASVSCTSDNRGGERLVGTLVIGGGPFELYYLEGLAGYDAEVGPDWELPIASHTAQGSLLVTVPEAGASIAGVMSAASLAALCRRRRRDSHGQLERPFARRLARTQPRC